MLLTGYTGQAYLGMGDPYLFTSIAAVAIGGASILGGSGHYVGTIAGALVLTILTGLLPALNLSSGALLIVYGAVILVTVSLGSEAFSDIGGRLRKRQAQAGREGVLAMIEITCVVDAQAELGEGTLLGPAGRRPLVDRHLADRLIHRYDPATGKDDTWEAPEYLGCLGLRETRRARPHHGERLPFLRSRDRAASSRSSIRKRDMPDTRFNDGKTDRQGRFWSGTMFEAPGKAGRVRRRALAARPRPLGATG